jgi:hypothetical protein
VWNRGRPTDSVDEWRGVRFGLILLVIIAGVYPLVEDLTARPLAVFALPTLLTAVIGGWRPTAAVGALSLATAAIIGASGPLSGPALAARLTVIALACLTGAIGAWFRDQQQARLIELAESNALLRAFERGMAPETERVNGFDVELRYVAAERHLRLGGDFLDAVGLPDGSLAVVVGDVCGHGPDEAAVGVALRSAWRAIALTHRPNPVEWVHRLHHMLAETGREGSYVTICTGVIDRRSREAWLVSAGHPWPIVVGDRVEVAKMSPGAPIGLGPPGWAVTTIDLADRRLLLYTDGLVENPLDGDEAQRWGEDGLLRWLGDQPQNPDQRAFLDGLMEAATAGRVLRDDVAVMAISCLRTRPAA